MPVSFYDVRRLQFFSDKVFLLYRLSENHDQIFTFREVVNETQQLIYLLESIGASETHTAVQCCHCPGLCVLLLSILNVASTFCPVPHDANVNELIDIVNSYGTTYLFSNYSHLDNIQFLRLVTKVCILGTDFYIYYAVHDNSKVLEKLPNECYSIQTSGSTGVPKIVRVPYECIFPNIKGLSEKLNVTREDLILLSTPITFDPFVVEFFLALYNGCGLLILHRNFRTNTSYEIGALFSERLCGPTIMQTTPSLFRRFGLENIQNKLLNGQTTLRILILGGERFPPMKEVLEWTAGNCEKTKIFNVYGITEMSCWSTIYEVKPSDVDNNIPLGSPIDEETEIRIVNETGEIISQGSGHIQIGSCTRKCLINDEPWMPSESDNMVFLATGDIGFISEDNLYFQGRENEVIKRYGNRICLQEIVYTILTIDGVLNAHSIFIESESRLICFIVKDEKSDPRNIKRQVNIKLKRIERPDNILFVGELPLTSHGKIFSEDLLKLFTLNKSNQSTPVSQFESYLTDVLGLNLDKSETSNEALLYTSFLEGGGTSIQALTLAAQIEEFLPHPDPKVLQLMMDGITTIEDIHEYISNLQTESSKITNSSYSSSINTGTLLEIKWQYNTGKCVDATPKCFGNVVCVGSHSHIVVVLDALSGHEICTCTLPDRIEGQVLFLDDRLLLTGCYDGVLYMIDYRCGSIEWTYNCGGMIKSRLHRKDNYVLVGNYSLTNNLVCIDLPFRKVRWKTHIGHKGIVASPQEISDSRVVVCTLDGYVACVTLCKGEIEWQIKFPTPIFSIPAVWEDGILIGEVTGVIHCLQHDSGIEMWNYQSAGNLFSNLVKHKLNDETYVIFGNHDHNVYCLKDIKTSVRPCIAWKSTLNSAVYSTPALMAIDADRLVVVACSTRGSVYLLNFLTGSILYRLDMEKEIFSSPYVQGNRIYVGCRSNNLVCLEFVQNKLIKQF